MAVLFSPASEELLGAPKHLFIRSAFLICQQSDVPIADRDMMEVVSATLNSQNINSVDAANFRRTGDYLSKILEQIRGVGFCIAIYSEGTRHKTLANIFLEIGMALLLGKPVVLVKTQQAIVPSDLVRSEYIQYDGDDRKLGLELEQTIKNSVLDTADYLCTLAEIAEDADSPDFELAFQRYSQALLMNGDRELICKLDGIKTSFATLLRNQVADPIRKRILDEMKIQVRNLQNQR